MTLTLEIEDKKQSRKLFFFDCNWRDPEIDNNITTLFDKHFDKYAVGRETSKSGVLHYQAYTSASSPSAYTNLIAQLKRTYKIVGRASKGKRRQYGAVKHIKDPSNALAYVLKENNYFSKGYNADTLKQIQATESFMPPDKPKDKMIQIVEEIQLLWENQNEESIWDMTDYRHDIVTILVEIYFEKFETLPRQATIMKLLYMAKILTARQYARLTAGKFIYLDGGTSSDYCYDKNYQQKIFREKGLKEKNQLYIVGNNI